MINPEDADGSGGGMVGGMVGGMAGGAIGAIGALGATQRPIIRLLHGPAMVVVDRRDMITTSGSVRDGITEGSPVYINDVGYITTEKPNDSSPIYGVVVNVDNNNVKIDIEPGVGIAYTHVVGHSGGVITEGGSYDPNKTIAYNEEECQSEELKTAKEVASERKDVMRKDEVRTTIDEDLMNALLED